jgi:hypothetical protein
MFSRSVPRTLAGRCKEEGILQQANVSSQAKARAAFLGKPAKQLKVCRRIIFGFNCPKLTFRTISVFFSDTKAQKSPQKNILRA